mmetsp:Transcript_2145/g.8303  ORF Transcript_2145/g.8303 Transcript_2145/m.8303 type:complete len:321 (+) Transcript_2145:474-1436(+)
MASGSLASSAASPGGERSRGEAGMPSPARPAAMTWSIGDGAPLVAWWCASSNPTSLWCEVAWCARPSSTSPPCLEADDRRDSSGGPEASASGNNRGVSALSASGASLLKKPASLPALPTRRPRARDEKLARATRTSAGPSERSAPSLAWPSSWSFPAKASPAMKSDTVRPTDEMTPATTRWRNVMPAGRWNPNDAAIDEPSVMPSVLPINKERTMTNEKPPASSNRTPALTAPNPKSTKKSTKLLTASSKSWSGDACEAISPCETTCIEPKCSTSSSSIGALTGLSRRMGMNGTTKHSARDGWTRAKRSPNHATGPAKNT